MHKHEAPRSPVTGSWSTFHLCCTAQYLRGVEGEFVFSPLGTAQILTEEITAMLTRCSGTRLVEFFRGFSGVMCSSALFRVPLQSYVDHIWSYVDSVEQIQLVTTHKNFKLLEKACSRKQHSPVLHNRNTSKELCPSIISFPFVCLGLHEAVQQVIT